MAPPSMVPRLCSAFTSVHSSLSHDPRFTIPPSVTPKGWGSVGQVGCVGYRRWDVVGWKVERKAWGNSRGLCPVSHPFGLSFSPFIRSQRVTPPPAPYGSQPLRGVWNEKECG